MNIKQLLLTVSIVTSIFFTTTAVACQSPIGKSDFLLITGFVSAWMIAVYLDAKYTKTLVKSENKPITINPKQ